MPVDQKRFSPVEERSYVYRHIHPHGRIIGKPGRRQRQSFEPLATKSLGKPSEVIVLHDVSEEPQVARKLNIPACGPIPPDGGEAGHSLLSAENIDAIVTGKQQQAGQEEVNTSIDALRPGSSVLETGEFNSLVRKLFDGYNTRQLARYVVQSLSPDHVSSAQAGQQVDKELRATQWQAGRTPLEQRVGRVSLTKNEAGTTKVNIAQQIVRNVWNLSIHTEEQRLGELELYLEPWQIKMMFDLKLDDKPAISTFIASPLLLRTADVRPYRPDNVLRITARRQDAAEIVRQVQVKFASVRRLDVDLGVFKTLLGRNGWPVSLDGLFKEDDVRYVSDRTGSVIESVAGDSLSIYTLPDRNIHASEARRLLLSLLDLPSPIETRTVVPSDSVDGNRRPSPLRTFSGRADSLVRKTYTAQSLHRRHHGKELVRLTAPTSKHEHTQSTETRPEDPHHSRKRLAAVLKAMPPSRISSISACEHEPSDSAWRLSRGGRMSNWQANFCVLLSNASDATPLGVTHAAQPFITLHEQPNLSQLLSYFKPVQQLGSTGPGNLTGDASQRQADVDRTIPCLVTHFTPTPFSKQGVRALGTLPRIALFSNFDQQTQKLNILGVSAALSEQEIQVPFPKQAVDLAFRRVSSMHFGHSTADEQRKFLGAFEGFTDRLQTSIQAGSGALDAIAELDVKLPWWMVHRTPRQRIKAVTKDDTAVPYLFDGMVHQQTLEFVPDKDGWQTSHKRTVDPEMSVLFEQWPEGMILRLQEVEGGASGGRRTELSLLYGGKRLAASKPRGSREKDAQDPARPTNSDTENDDVAEKTALHISTGNISAEPERLIEDWSFTLTTTALRLLRVLTRANAGQLPSLTYDYDGSFKAAPHSHS